jgi:hypothetical protein
MSSIGLNHFYLKVFGGRRSVLHEIIEYDGDPTGVLTERKGTILHDYTNDHYYLNVSPLGMPSTFWNIIDTIPLG